MRPSFLLALTLALAACGAHESLPAPLGDCEPTDGASCAKPPAGVGGSTGGGAQPGQGGTGAGQGQMGQDGGAATDASSIFVGDGAAAPASDAALGTD